MALCICRPGDKSAEMVHGFGDRRFRNGLLVGASPETPTKPSPLNPAFSSVPN